MLFKFASILDGKAPSKTVFALKPDHPPTQARQSVYVPQWQSRPSGTTVLACALVDLTPHFLSDEPPSPTGQLTPLGRTPFNLDVGTGPPPCSESTSVAAAPLTAAASSSEPADVAPAAASEPADLAVATSQASPLNDSATSDPAGAASASRKRPLRAAAAERRFFIGETVVAEGAVIAKGSTEDRIFTGTVPRTYTMHTRSQTQPCAGVCSAPRRCVRLASAGAAPPRLRSSHRRVPRRRRQRHVRDVALWPVLNKHLGCTGPHKVVLKLMVNANAGTVRRGSRERPAARAYCAIYAYRT